MVANPMGPVIRGGHQGLADWIHADVEPFFREFRRIAQTVVDEIPLPLYAVAGGKKMFPLTIGSRHCGVRREGNQQVDMVGHEQEKVEEPASGRMIGASRFHQRRGVGQQWPIRPVFCANRQEIDGQFVAPCCGRGSSMSKRMPVWEWLVRSDGHGAWKSVNMCFISWEGKEGKSFWGAGAGKGLTKGRGRGRGWSCKGERR